MNELEKKEGIVLEIGKERQRLELIVCSSIAKPYKIKA